MQEVYREQMISTNLKELGYLHMKKLGKALGFITGLIILLIIIAAVLLKTLVNPNRFKQEISQAVETHIGRTLNIQGEMRLSFFPWLGIDIRQITLDNPQNFPQKEFVDVGEAQVKVKLFPLFLGHVDVKEIKLKKLDLNLITTKNGEQNWVFPPQKTQVTPLTNSEIPLKSAPQPTKPALFAVGLLRIGNLSIEEASIKAQDQTTGKTWTLNRLNLYSQNFNLTGHPFHMNSSFSYQQEKPLIDLHTEASIALSIQPDNHSIEIKNLSVNALVKAYKTPFLKPIPLSLHLTDFKKSLSHFALSQATLSLLNTQLTTQFNAQYEQGLKQLSGTFRLSQANPSQWASEMGSLSDLKVLHSIRNFGIDLTAKTENHKILIEPLTLEINHSLIQGRGVFTPLTQNAFELQLESDALDIQELPFKNLSLMAQYRNRQLTIKPLNARLFGGNITATLNQNYQTATHPLEIILQASALPLPPILTALESKIPLSGIADFSTSLTTQGLDTPSLIAHLNGQGQLIITHGEIAGVNLDALIKQGNDFLVNHRLTQPTNNQKPVTQFTTCKTTYTIKNGIAYSQLAIFTTHTQATGNGEINLANQGIHYQLAVGPQSQSGKKTWQFPLIISGTITNPHFAPNIEAIAGEVIQNLIGDAINKALNKPSDEKQKTEEPNRKIENLFKGLFN